MSPAIHRLRETDRTDRETGSDGEIKVHCPAVHRPGEGDREVTVRRGVMGRFRFTVPRSTDREKVTEK